MKRQRVDKYEGPKILGIDVSHWNGEIEWAAIDEDYKFVYIRFGDGKDEDIRFRENWAGCRQDQDMRQGAYIYFRADRDGATQARAFCEAMREVGYRPGYDLPPVLDFEHGARKNLSGGIYTGPEEYLDVELVLDEVFEWLCIVEEELGVRPVVYTGWVVHHWYSQARPHLAVPLAEYPLWIASYTKGPAPYMPVNTAGDGFPWPEWTFWQFTSRGESAGIASAGLDVNYFRGTEEALALFCVQSCTGGEPMNDLEAVDDLEAVNDLQDHVESLLAVVMDLQQMCSELYSELEEVLDKLK